MEIAFENGSIFNFNIHGSKTNDLISLHCWSGKMADFKYSMKK